MALGGAALGGRRQLLTPDNKKAAFDSAGGLTSLNTLRTMAVTRQVDVPGPDRLRVRQPVQLGQDRDAGHRAVGPVRRSPTCKYGVQVMPSYPGTSGGHQTISGPGQLGDLQQRRGAGGRGREVPALADRAGPGQVLLAARPATCRPGSRWPTRPGSTSRWTPRCPASSTFIANLANVKQARPQIPSYPKISTILGNMIVSVLLGKSQPQAALAAAAQQVNQVLAGCGLTGWRLTRRTAGAAPAAGRPGRPAVGRPGRDGLRAVHRVGVRHARPSRSSCCSARCRSSGRR